MGGGEGGYASFCTGGIAPLYKPNGAAPVDLIRDEPSAKRGRFSLCEPGE